MSMMKIKFDKNEFSSVKVCENLTTGDDCTALIILPCGQDAEDIEICGCDEVKSSEDDSPIAWVGADGDTTQICDMKDSNILGLIKKFQKNKVTQVFAGWYDALTCEADERGLDYDECQC